MSGNPIIKFQVKSCENSKHFGLHTENPIRVGFTVLTNQQEFSPFAAPVMIFFTDSQSEKQVCDSNVIYLAKTSPPAVVWWLGDRWVVWSTAVRRLKDIPRHGWDWTFPQPALASSPILISLDSVRQTNVWSLYRARCRIPQSIDFETHLTVRCES